MTLESQGISNSEPLQLTNIGLHAETLLILNNRYDLLDDASDTDVDNLIKHYGEVLFQKDVDPKEAFSWVMYRVRRDLVDLSYLITTNEGEKFLDSYKYLHRTMAKLFAHSHNYPGNAYMVDGGDTFINQFPNQYHVAFINRLVTSIKNHEDGVDMFGGSFDSQFVYHARDYIIQLGNMSETLNPVNAEFAQRLGFFGITLPGGRFLERISPRDVTKQNTDRPIAKLFRENTTRVRKYLFEVFNEVASPGTILELLGEYFSDETQLDYYQFYRVFELVEVLQNITKTYYLEYQSVLIQKIQELNKKGVKVPQKVLDVIYRVDPFIEYSSLEIV